MNGSAEEWIVNTHAPIRHQCHQIHSFIHSFIRSIVHSFIRSFVLSLIHSFILSFIRSFIHSSFAYSFIRSFIHSLIRSFVHSFIHQWLYSLLLGPGLFLQFRNLFYTDGGPPWTSDQPIARPPPTQRTTQTQKNAHTDIHALSEIRTHDHSVRAREDSLCLRPRGHRYRQCHRIQAKNLWNSLL
jgi:hypothetical protein